MKKVVWTDYFKYRATLRGFDLLNVEEILRYGTERYYDTVTDRFVVIGKDANVMVMIPHEKPDERTIIPVTIHATSRQQINCRVKSGRFQNE
jgi:hypothetical protein